MKRTIKISALILAHTWLCTLTVCAETPASQVKDLLMGRSNVDLSRTPASERPAIVEELKKFAAEPNGAFARSATKELMKLGDTQTTAAQITQFRNASSLRQAHDAATVLALSADPVVIVELAPELFRDEGSSEVHDKVSLEYPRSIQAAAVIAAVAIKCQQFSKAVGDSMAKLQASQPADRRATLQRWWTKNQSALAARNYAGVRPAHE
jgi:hypothetical protein